jgi:two-component system cell cycle response regulator
VGGLLRNTVRINDVACRYSTQQLAILLPETDAEGLQAAADRLRVSLADREFLTRRQGAGFRITVSQGGATVPSAQITTRIEMLRVAEAALGEARLAGTDQVRVIEPILLPESQPGTAA